MLAEKAALFGCLMMMAGQAVVADEEVPDPEFLEYLGTWEETDEDWLIFRTPVAAELDEEQSEDLPRDEESTETSDES